MFHALAVLLNVVLLYMNISMIRSQDMAWKISERRDMVRQMNYIRDRIAESAKNSASWNATVALSGAAGAQLCNQQLSCLRTGTDCFAALASGGAIVAQPVPCIPDIMNPTTLFWDGRQPTAGLDVSGNPCNTFSEITPSATCIFRPIVTWKPLCSASPCVGAAGEISVQVKAVSANLRNLNSSRREIKLIRN